MGRARGGLHGDGGSVRRGGSSGPQTPAERLGLTATPHPLDTLLRPAGKQPARDGHLLVLPDALHVLPRGRLADGTRAFLMRVPDERRALYGHVLRRLWVLGQRPTAPELARLLTEQDGVTTRDLGRGDGKGARLADADLRAELPELMHRLRLPIVSDTNGYRRARDRADVRAAAESLRRRADNTAAPADAMERYGGGWLRGQAPPNMTLTPGQRRVLAALLQSLKRGKDGALTDGELALRLAEERVTMDDWTGRAARTGDDPERTPPPIAGTALREVLNHAGRTWGLPVISGSKGYWVAADERELADGIASRRARADAMRWHAGVLDEAGAFVWPQTPEERAEREAAVSAGRSELRGWSEEYRQRQQRAAEARKAQSKHRSEHRKRTLDAHRSEARKRYDDMRTTAEALLRRRARGGRAALTREENVLADELKAASRFANGGPPPPPDKDYAWAPVRKTRNPKPQVAPRRRATTPVEPLPWATAS